MSVDKALPCDSLSLAPRGEKQLQLANEIHRLTPINRPTKELMILCC